METRVHISELPLRPQDEVECRRCEVHCDKVVYPAACVEKSVPVPLRDRGVRAPLRRLHAERVRRRDRRRPARRSRANAQRLRRGQGDAPSAADVHDDRRPVLRDRASTSSGASTPSSTSCRSASRRSRSSRAYRSTSGRSAAAPTAAVARRAAKNATRHDAPATTAANAIGMTIPPTPSTVC